jgi:hypothetical protein
MAGGILLVLAPIKYQIRKKKIIILNPIKAIIEYDRYERLLLIFGTLLTVIGLISFIVISKTMGYYYFKDGIPTLLKN